ncbi:MAG: hypothetical protein NTU61_03175 [Candidatus Altiarchaeota archaeon]|nr:hypothetical protein [Candidatus Altiarchaeota archaeon]
MGESEDSTPKKPAYSKADELSRKYGILPAKDEEQEQSEPEPASATPAQDSAKQEAGVRVASLDEIKERQAMRAKSQILRATNAPPSEPKTPFVEQDKEYAGIKNQPEKPQQTLEDLTKKYGIPEKEKPQKKTEQPKDSGMQYEIGAKEKPAGKPSPKKPPAPEGKNPPHKNFLPAVIILILVMGVLAVAAGLGYYALGNLDQAVTLIQQILNNSQQTRIMYQCLDGSFQEDPSMCPTTTAVTTTSTTLQQASTTATTLTPVTTTIPKVACYTTSDCLKNQTNSTFCEDNVVKRVYIQYTCMHPGKSDAQCVARTGNPTIVKSCDTGEYCLSGECYPKNCQDHKRNFNETKVDCGGPCRPCTTEDPACLTDLDCGGTQRIGNYTCKNGNPVTTYQYNTCVKPDTNNATCTTKNTTEIVEHCQQGQQCVDGNAGCYYIDVNCQDCMQNQGEDEIDCGGPCPPCAVKPSVYDTLDLKIATNYTYRRYTIVLNNVIQTKTNCTSGASVFVSTPDGVPTSNTLDLRTSADVYGLQVGFINGTTKSALIWLWK